MSPVAALLVSVAIVTGGELHSKHFFHGHPTGTPESNDLIIRDCYALSSNDTSKFADWVAYRLTLQEVFGTLDLERDWMADPWLAENETLEPGSSTDDYRGANAAHDYQRGHLAPLASFKGSPFASQVNYYSNIVPQKAAMNGGPWGDVEDAVRNLVRKYGVVWVMAGTLYESPMPALPNADEFHTVPSGFWKIVAVIDDGDIKVAGFIVDQNAARNETIVDQQVTIDAIEMRSSLEFLRLLPAAQQQTLESVMDSAWVAAEFKTDRLELPMP